MSEPQQETGIDYFDGEAPQAAPENTLERLVELCDRARDLENEVAQATVTLNEKQGQLDRILKDFIPTVMEGLGMEKFVLKDGRKVEVKEDIKCNLSEERRPAGLAWIREHNFGGIIKTAVSCAFGKGEEQDAMRAVTVLREAGFMPGLDEGVHPQTLKSFVKERLEAGDSIPLDVFGVFDFKLAKIVAPKAKK